jgi:hypothetical protein
MSDTQQSVVFCPHPLINIKLLFTRQIIKGLPICAYDSNWSQDRHILFLLFLLLI